MKGHKVAESGSSGVRGHGSILTTNWQNGFRKSKLRTSHMLQGPKPAQCGLLLPFTHLLQDLMC